jgi:hypothetical protein
VAVAEPATAASPARVICEPIALTSWLPAGPTMATINRRRLGGLQLRVALYDGDLRLVLRVVLLDRELGEVQLLAADLRDLPRDRRHDADLRGAVRVRLLG